MGIVSLNSLQLRQLLAGRCRQLLPLLTYWQSVVVAAVDLGLQVVVVVVGSLRPRIIQLLLETFTQ
jgi:hypothetical protein